MPKLAEPFLKWPGGKRWTAPSIAEIVRRRLALTGRYFEPFLGGGAVFFALNHPRSVLSDINPELIETYLAVRDSSPRLVRSIRRIPVSEADFYRVRAEHPPTRHRRAVRFLYLNRTSFAGMYRLNSLGNFNVPFGGGQRTPAALWERRLLDRAAESLRSAELAACDFAIALRSATYGDVVYCDPTYTVAHANNGFVRYNERNFSWSDQERLAYEASEAAARGVTVIISNAYHHEIARLYREWPRRILRRTSRVCPNPASRSIVSEYLFISRLANTNG